MTKTRAPKKGRKGNDSDEPTLSETFSDSIQIRGAREHNLKDIHLDIPRDKFVVITGVSGSGKSTLAFDILFAEGQRRFLDSMNAYARQFVEQMARPEVDLVSGLPPTVSIEQRNTRGGGKSTVATVTEIYQFLRLLYARLGTQYCPECGDPVKPQTRDRIIQQVLNKLKSSGPLKVLAPVIRNRKGFHTEVAQLALKLGHTFLRADGEIVEADLSFKLDRFKEHDVEIVIGELPKKKTYRDADKQQLQEFVENGLKVGKGSIYTLDSKGHISVHSLHRSCPSCERSFDELDPKMFSYNSSRGWCPKCRGFGEIFDMPERDRGARAGDIEESWFHWLDGDREICPDCNGARLNRDSLAVLLEVSEMVKKPLPKPVKDQPVLGLENLGEMTVSTAKKYFSSLKLIGRSQEIGRDILSEINERLKFLESVGLGYLQLGRSVTTLSGGEGQRIRLASQLGSNLSGVAYVLDEPTIGLHARDNFQLLDALQLLKERGNTLIVVEHDEDTMRKADFIVDLGPAAGVRGGEVVGTGTLDELMDQPQSLTGKCLKEVRQFPSRGERRKVSKRDSFLSLKNARLNNLKNVQVQIPIGRFTAVSGVSGSGKSTLIKECLRPAVEAALSGEKYPEILGEIKGWENFKSVHEVDQTPIGRTPRSTPATYVGLFDEIRKVYAQLPESRMRGFDAGKFSFNSPKGRCPACAGAGVIKIEMNFLPTAYVDCDLCQGGRYAEDVLDVEYQGLNISQVLNLSVGEAVEFFGAFSKIKKPLEALVATGLDYLKLGQTSPTLSGGEAQRLKLVSHLLSGMNKKIPKLSDLKEPGAQKLFILEEPTIGLHTDDVRKLIGVIHQLVDNGNTVVVIEHQLDLIAEADWVIDLGPEGGEKGGEILVSGTPEKVASSKKSYTGQYLRALMGTI